MDYVNIQNTVQDNLKAISYCLFDTISPLSVIDIFTLDNSAYYAPGTIIITLSNHKNIVFLQSDINVEFNFNKYLSWFNHTLFPSQQLHLKQILNYSDHGYTEYYFYTPPKDPIDFCNYYTKLGQLFSILYSIGIAEIDYSKIISFNSSPVITNLSPMITRPIQFLDIPPPYPELFKHYVASHNRFFSSENQFYTSYLTNLNYFKYGYTRTCYYIQIHKEQIRTLQDLIFKYDRGK